MARRSRSTGNNGGTVHQRHNSRHLLLCLLLCTLLQIPSFSSARSVPLNITQFSGQDGTNVRSFFAPKDHSLNTRQDNSNSHEVYHPTAFPEPLDSTTPILPISAPYKLQKNTHSTEYDTVRRTQREREWFQQLKWEFTPSHQGHYSGSRSSLNLPSSRQVRLFVEYLNPTFKQNINPQQIHNIVNQWHLFRKFARKNRQLKHLRDLETQAIQRRKQQDRMVMDEKATFQAFVLRREARALQKASSFEEFQRILVRPEKSTRDDSDFPLMSLPSFPEIGGGVVFHEKPVNGVLSESKPRPISKRSLENPEYNDNEHWDESEDLESEDHSQQELHGAYVSYQEFLSNSCTPRNKTICMKALLGSGLVDHSTLVLPPGAHVKRCDNPTWSSSHGSFSTVNSYQTMFNQATRLRSKKALQSLCNAADTIDTVSGFGQSSALNNFLHHDFGGSCNCALPEEECLPTEVDLKLVTVVAYNTVNHSTKTEVIALTEHLACGCRRRCENRKCIPPLKLNNYTYDDCFCTCPDGDERCQALLEGRARFRDDELMLPLDGSYMLPPCYHGPMDDVHIYHRHCPRANGRVGFDEVKSEA